MRGRHRSGARADQPRGYRFAHVRVVKDGLGLMWDPYTVLTERQVRAARQEAYLHLDYWARRLGARHGLKAFAIEPAAWQGGHACYLQHQFVGHFLGLAPEGAGGDADLRQFLQGNAEPRTPFEDEPHLTLGTLRPLLTRAFAWPSVMLFGPEQWGALRRQHEGLAHLPRRRRVAKAPGRAGEAGSLRTPAPRAA